MTLKLRYRLSLIFAVILFSSIAHAAVPVDITGVWIDSRDGKEINLVRNGDEIYAKDIADSGIYWFATQRSDKLTGKFHARRLKDLPEARAIALCKDRFRFEADARLTISMDGNTLTGEWLNRDSDKKNCADKGISTWEPLSYTRKPVPPPFFVEEKPSQTKGYLLGGLIMLATVVVGFFIRNVYVNYLVASRKRAPNTAGIAGWALFGGLLFASAIGGVAVGNAELLSLPVLAPLGGIVVALFSLCAVFSGKK